MFPRTFAGRSKVVGPLAAEIELLRKSPLLDPVWYRETYIDLRAMPVDVARHYLEYGAREGRNPSPLFDTKFYLEQNPDVVTAGINPLIHYILHGEAEGRPIKPASLLSEPGIRPPLPVTKSNDQQHTRSIQIVSAIRALRSRNTGENVSPKEFGLREDEAKLLAAKLANLGNSLPVEAVVAALKGGAEARTAVGTGGALDGLLGLGIVPPRIVNCDALPADNSSIASRYNRERTNAGRRFSLTPPGTSTIDSGPIISILVPVFKTPIVYLARAILSVLFQTYVNWELILIDDCSQHPGVEAVLEFYRQVDPRVKVYFKPKNEGISAATNEALRRASGSYIGLLDHDDMLANDALQRVVERIINDDSLDLIYSDECKIDSDDLVDDLFFKPDWSPLLLLNFMYTGHFSVYKRAIVEKVGGFHSEYDFSQDYDLVLRVAERNPKVAHIAECLYGWRMISGSAAIGDKADARNSNIAALQDAADRRGYCGVAIALPTANRIKRLFDQTRPLISIIIPSDDYRNIQTTIDSIISYSTYVNYEIIVVTNSELIERHGGDLVSSSSVRLINYDKPYNFSDKCNIGTKHAKGDYVVFYNDDVRVISPDWMEALLEYLTLPGIGAVAPKLNYENGTIQHAGMVTGVRRFVGTAFHAYPANTTAYFNFAQSVREVSTLSGACLALPINVFREIGGFDAINTPIAHSDIDLCFRVRKSGRSCVYTPHAALTHIGHLSIGATEVEESRASKSVRKDKADIFLLKKWGRYLERDPYFPTKMRDILYIDSQEPFHYFSSGAAIPHAGSDVLIFSHDLSGSGAPKIAYDIAKVLLEEGCFVVVFSPDDGVFRQRLLEIGAHVIVDPLALTRHDAVTAFARNFDVVIANTAICWPVIEQIAPFAPVYCYIHETEVLKDLARGEPAFGKAFGYATAVWAGSKLSQDYLGDCGISSRVFEYGVEEPKERNTLALPADRDLVISVLATFEARKGQDLAVLGFAAMPEDRRNRCRLRLIGRSHDTHFRNAVEGLAAESGRIDFEGELNYDAYLERMSETDIVLCPSRDDTLPLVSLNALAAGKILICSAQTGTSNYITDGVSGFVLKANSPEQIGETLARAVDAIESWPAIGEEARRVFARNFSLERFRSRLLKELGFALHSATSEGPSLIERAERM